MSIFIHIPDPQPLVLEVDGRSESDVVDWVKRTMQDGEAIEVHIPGPQIRHVVINLRRVPVVEVTQDRPANTVTPIRFAVPAASFAPRRLR